MAKNDLIITTIGAWKNYDFDSVSASSVANLCVEQVFDIVMDGGRNRDAVIGAMVQDTIKNIDLSKIEKQKGIKRALEVLEQIKKNVISNATEEIEALIDGLK